MTRSYAESPSLEYRVRSLYAYEAQRPEELSEWTLPSYANHSHPPNPL